MSEAWQFVGYHLLNSTEVQDYTTHVYHGNIPETDTYMPVINYFMVSRPEIADGAADKPRYQISCRARNPQTAMLLANSVKSAFTEIQDYIGGFSVQNTHFVGSQFLREPDNVYHVPVDIYITYTNY